MTMTDTKPASSTGSRPSDSLGEDVLKKWLRDMLLIREFELRTMAAYQQAKIGGFCHIYIGQEAVAVGTIGSVEHTDPVVTAYRDHGHALARGMDPKACMAEMYGRLSGCAKGKGGSMHMFDKPNHLYGGHGIVGAQTPLGLGLAFAARYENEVIGESVVEGVEPSKKVALCYLGDGALNQGALHEAMNLSNLPGQLRSPVLFCLENNKYSMGTAIDRGTTQADNLKAKADAYGMAYAEFDGMDVLSVYDGMKPLVDECREEQKPAFVNIHCYRFQGHSMSDPQKYRSKDEVQTYQEQDPIEKLKKVVVDERGIMSDDDYKDMQKELKAIVKEAVQFAEDEPEPDVSELLSDVMVNPHPRMSPTAKYVDGAKNPLL